MYSFSIKSRKYETQTDLEKVHDTPRLHVGDASYHKRGYHNPADVKNWMAILAEHNRTAGVFDYNYNQNFYSHCADIDQEAYIIIGQGASHYAHKHYENGHILSQENKRA